MTVFSIGLILVVICHYLQRPKVARLLFALSLCWLFVWGTDCVSRQLVFWIEKNYPPIPMDKVPSADVIVVLGGGMAPPKGVCSCPELYGGADRVWHAARLYHAGKAPVIMPTGCTEANSSVVFLKALGVPSSAIIVETKANNTIENGLYSKELMQKNGFTNALLVTSAFHMRRAEMIFRTIGVQVVPVATDYETTGGCFEESDGAKNPLSWLTVLRCFPSASILDRNAWYLKEFVGYWGDAWRLRKYKRQ